MSARRSHACAFVVGQVARVAQVAGAGVSVRQSTHPAAGDVGEAALPGDRNGEVGARVVQVQATLSQQEWGYDWPLEGWPTARLS